MPSAVPGELVFSGARLPPSGVDVDARQQRRADDEENEHREDGVAPAAAERDDPANTAGPSTPA